MKRIYISGPITGNPQAEEQFRAAEQTLAEDWTVWNPQKVNAAVVALTGISTHEEYMGISLAGLELCDAIWMLPGWQDSRGARMEYNYAKSNGKNIYVNGAQEEKETFAYAGACLFCGQITAIEADEVLKQSEIEERATLVCNCEAARRHQKKVTQKEIARETIEETFSADRAEGLRYAMLKMIDHVAGRNVAKVTMKKDEYIGTMSYSEKNDAIKIGFEKKNKIETEV